MRLTNFKQFEAAKSLLEKHTIEEIENGKMLEGMDEFAGMDNPIASVRPVNEFLGIKTAILNGISKIMPGGALNKANAILKEYETLYSTKAAELIKNKRALADRRMKVKEAEESGSAQLDSLRAALQTLIEAQGAREENNKKKWTAIENQLNTKIAELKKANKDSDRVQSYINIKLAEMRVNAYTKIEKDFEKFGTEKEIKAFTMALEDEKKKFKKFEVELAKETQAPETPVGGDTTGNDEPKLKEPADGETAGQEKTDAEIKSEVSLDSGTETKPEEKPKETTPPVKVVVDDIKPGAKFIYRSNKYPEGKEVEIVEVPEDSPVKVKYIGADDPEIKDKVVQTYYKDALVDQLENIK